MNKSPEPPEAQLSQLCKVSPTLQLCVAKIRD